MRHSERLARSVPRVFGPQREAPLAVAHVATGSRITKCRAVDWFCGDASCHHHEARALKRWKSGLQGGKRTVVGTWNT